MRCNKHRSPLAILSPVLHPSFPGVLQLLQRPKITSAKPRARSCLTATLPPCALHKQYSSEHTFWPKINSLCLATLAPLI